VIRLASVNVALCPQYPACLPACPQTPQTLGGSEFVPGELDAVGEAEDGGEFDPADLELEEEGGGGVVEESAGEPFCVAACVAACVACGV
jgi:hypothetical protein